MRWIVTYRRLIFVTPLLAGCVIFESRSTNLLADLADNRALWEAAGLTDYTMQFQRQCLFCPVELITPVELTVRDDVIEAVFDLELQEPRTEWPDGAYLTVTELFDSVQDAIDQEAAEIKIRYDGTLGYPAEINIDFNRRFVDDDIDLLVQDVTPLN